VRHKESLFIIDELSREARMDEDYDANEDDRSPVHSMFDLHESDDEDVRASVTKGDIPAGYPGPEYLEDWDADLSRDDADGMGGLADKEAMSERIAVEDIPVTLDIGTLPPPGSIILEKEGEEEDIIPEAGTVPER